MRYKESSWKQKVDPAFDKFIKLYLFFFETIKIPSSEGYLSIELADRYLKKLEIEGFPGIASMYEHDKEEDAQFDLISMLDNTFTLQDFKKIKKEINKDVQSFYEFFLSISEQLEESSREYYLKKFEPLRSEDSYKIHIESMNEIKLQKLKKEILSDQQSLQWQCVVNAIEYVKENIDSKRKTIVKRFNEQPKIFKRSIFFCVGYNFYLCTQKGSKEFIH